MTPDVPETEPPVGTVASFSGLFRTGGGYTTGLHLRHANGWGDDAVRPRDNEAVSWAELTDLDTINADLQRRNPGSAERVVRVVVSVVAGPPANTDSVAIDTLIGASRHLRATRDRKGHRYRGFDLAADILLYGAQDVTESALTPLVREIDAVTAERLAFHAGLAAATEPKPL